MSGRIVLIKGGGDWCDASVDPLVVPEGMDLDAELDEYNQWYREAYLPALRAGEGPKFMGFPDWLVGRGATPSPIEEFWEM